MPQLVERFLIISAEVEYMSLYTKSRLSILLVEGVRKSRNGWGQKEPLVSINSILMIDYKNTLKTFATFGTNITVGCLGLFNPAKNTVFYRDNKKGGFNL